MDFGLAVSLKARVRPDRLILGTPEYMSPEQVDCRTSIPGPISTPRRHPVRDGGPARYPSKVKRRWPWL
jgi:serine/threonine protein kinase